MVRRKHVRWEILLLLWSLSWILFHRNHLSEGGKWNHYQTLLEQCRNCLCCRNWKCHNYKYYLHYIYYEIPPFLVFLLSSLSSIYVVDVTTLCFVKEIATKPTRLSDRLPVSPTVLGEMSIWETAQTFLELSPILELFVSLPWDEVVGLEVLYCPQALWAVHVSHWFPFFILPGWFWVGAMAL